MGQKTVFKCTIEAHLQRDYGFLGSIPPNTVSAAFVQSCIDWTTKLLAQIHEEHESLIVASDPDGSRSEGSEGALLESST
jgi:hypothetical protein